MGWKLDEIIESAKDDLREQMKDGYNADDSVHEIADSSVPVYTHTLLELFVDDIDLAFVEPEIGYGTAGQNMVGIAQAIIYEEITRALYEEKDSIQENLAEIQELHEERQDLEEESREVEGDNRLDESERADRLREIRERLEEIDEEIHDLEEG